VKLEVCEIAQEELLTLSNNDTDRVYCNLCVNQHKVHLLLDCGASVNVLPLKHATAVRQLQYVSGTLLVAADTLSLACLADETTQRADEEIAEITDAEQLDALKMVASPATIEPIRSAASADYRYQLLRQQIDVGWHDASIVSLASKVDGLVIKGDRVVVLRDSTASAFVAHRDEWLYPGCTRSSLLSRLITSH